MAKAFEFCNLHPKCRRRVGHTGLCVTFDGEFDMQKKISTDPDAEIARLKTELSTNWAKHESTVKKPLSIKEAIESINSGPGWVTAITISRTEWERLLTAIQEIEKDAERYRKLKRDWIALSVSNRPIVMQRFVMGIENKLDRFIDALPEVES